MEEENTIIKEGILDYNQLRKIIVDYFKQTQDLDLLYPSIDYLQDKLAHNSNTEPYFAVENEFGETRFDISKEDIEKILKSYLASEDRELTSGPEYKDFNTIYYSYKPNSEIKNEMNKPENKVELDLTYDGFINNDDLKRTILNYYKKTKGIEFDSIDINFLQNQSNIQNEDQPIFSCTGYFNDTKFNIPHEEIKNIMEDYLSNKGYELTNLFYGNSLRFQFKKTKKNEQNKSIDESSIDLNDELLDKQFDEMWNAEPEDKSEEVENVEDDDKFEYLGIVNPENKSEFDGFNEPKPINSPVHVIDDELERTSREKRKFTILQKERAMTEAQRSKNRSAIIAGICILGAAAAVYFNGQDPNEVVQHELNAIYSWDALKSYIQDLGPLATLLGASSAVFLTNCFRQSKRLKDAQHWFEDYNSSLENTNELGGNENVKTR